MRVERKATTGNEKAGNEMTGNWEEGAWNVDNERVKGRELVSE